MTYDLVNLRTLVEKTRTQILREMIEGIKAVGG